MPAVVGGLVRGATVRRGHPPAARGPAAGPRDDARAAGRSTALPPESTLTLRRVREGVAEIEVEVDPETAISADRLPAAVGQVVLTAISTSGVRAVVFVSGGEPVRVPLPGGALVARPVTAADYKELLPAWLPALPGTGLP